MSFDTDELRRRKRLAGNLAIRLCKEHRDWTWERIACEARRDTGLDPWRWDSKKGLP